MSPAPLATPRATARRLHQSRGVPRSPRGPREVPRGSRLAVWLDRARLRFGVARRACGGASARETSRLIAIRHWIAPFGAHVGVSRPRCRWQLCGGGTLPRRHESLTSFSVSTTLAATGPKAAFGACHYPFSSFRPRNACQGSDRLARRAAPEPPSAERRAQTHRVGCGLRTGPRASQGGTASAPSGGVTRAPRATVRSGPLEAGRMGGAWRRCRRSARSCRRCRSSRVSSDCAAARRRPPESGRQRTRFERYRVRVAPRARDQPPAARCGCCSCRRSESPAIRTSSATPAFSPSVVSPGARMNQRSVE